VKWAANHLKITPRRFKQIYAKYKTNNTTPTIGQNLGRPKKQVTKETIELIKQAYERDKLNAVYLKKNHICTPKNSYILQNDPGSLT
jgi:hypothetical protein